MDRDDLPEQLELKAQYTDRYFDNAILGELYREAAAEIRSLRAELERRKYDGIHTCHDQCQRVACVLRRENEALRSQVEQERARARLEGAEIMREAVEEAIKHARPLDEGAVSWGDGWADTRLAIRAIDPAAILEAHMRGEEAA